MKQCRINDPATIDAGAVAKRHAAGDEIIIQFSKVTYNSKILREVEQLCRHFPNRLTVRFYGHHNSVIDCSIVKSLPSVKSLSIDCMMNAANHEAISVLENLTDFTLGIFYLEDRDLFEWPAFANLKSLRITETKRRNIDLCPWADTPSCCR